MVSIVDPKFKDRYREHGGTNGDALARKLNEYLKLGGQLHLQRLQKLASDNGVWKDSYADLNPGQQRMNVGNRLRALERKGQRLIWPEQ